MNSKLLPSPIVWGVFLGICVNLTQLQGAPVPYVIQISVDGLRGDLLEALVTNSPETYPNISRLQTEGAFTYNARCDYDFSETVPNHCTMVTGRPVLQPEGQPDTTHHGFFSNFPSPGSTIHDAGNPNLSYVPSVFDVVHDHGLSTALYLGKTRLGIIERSYNATGGGPDLIGEDNGNNKLDSSIVQNGNTVDLINAIASQLTNGPINYTFVHITDPDAAGHGTGFGSATWNDSIAVLDGYLGQVFDAIDANPALAGAIAISMTGDHGGGGGSPNSHTDATLAENYTVPFFLWGPGIPGGVDIYSLFAGRFNPGTSRPDYNAVEQPMRNGDAANLSMALLGLPPIPGSFLLAELSAPDLVLDWERVGDTVLLSWDKFPPNLILEECDLANPVGFLSITSGIVDAGTEFQYVVDTSEGLLPGIYRLRQRAFSITAQPQPLDVQVGDTATFEVGTASESSLSYQWQYEGLNIPGATDASYTISSVQLADGGDYQVLVSDAFDTLSSDVAPLRVLVNPTIVSQPMSATNFAGTTAMFSVVAQGSGPLRYQWYAQGVPVVDGTNDTLVILNVQVGNEGDYTVVVTDDLGVTASDVARLTVYLEPVFRVQPQSQTVTVGENVTFSVTISAHPLPVGYRWRKFPATTLGNEVTSSLTSSFTITNVQLSQAGFYNVAVTNAANPFPGVLSANAELIVLEP